MSSLNPNLKVEKIVQLVRPQSILDVGCGTGQTVMQLQQLGIDVLGIEASKLAIRRCPRQDLILRHDLRKKIELRRLFDLVWCFEVAEHIHPRYVNIFIGNLVRHSQIIAMSAAHPGQGGEGHFNEQPQSYWEQKFSDYGYLLHEGWTAKMKSVPEFYSESMMVFTSREFAVPQQPSDRDNRDFGIVAQKLRVMVCSDVRHKRKIKAAGLGVLASGG